MPAVALLLAAAVASAEHVRELISKDRWQEALAEARVLSQAEPGSAATAALGEALYRAGRIDDAGDVLDPLAPSADAPPRALTQLGLVRAAQGRDEEAAKLFERAVAAAPEDPWVLLRAAGAAASRARAIELLNAYLARSAGDDPDRIEGARGTVRLYTALGERKIWVPVAHPDRIEIPIKPMLGGSGFFVEAMLTNKKKIRLLLDTGSTGLFVVERAVRKGGYAPLSEETVFAGGGAGRTPTSRGLLQHLAIGGLEFQDALVTTTTAEFDPQGRIHGVLGLNPFAGYRIGLDLAKGRMILEPAAAMTGGTPYWDVGGQLLVRVDAGGGTGGLFLLDTGAARSMVDTGFAASVPGAQVGAPAGVRTFGGNVAGATTVRGVTLRFLGLDSGTSLVHGADLTQRSRLGGVEVSGFLGMDLLDGARLVIDTRARRVDIAAPAARR